MSAGAGVLAGTAAQLKQAALWGADGYLALGAAGLAVWLALALGLWFKRRLERWLDQQNQQAWQRGAQALSQQAGQQQQGRLRQQQQQRQPGTQAKVGKLAAAAPALVTLAASAALAFAATGWRAQQRLADSLAPALEGVEIIVTGMVAALPQEHAQGSSFLFDIDQAERPGQGAGPGQPLPLGSVPRRVWLGWYAPGQTEADVGIAAGHPAPRAGQRWRLAVKLRQPRGLVNPNGFDAELWWFEQGIRALGSVREARVPPRLLSADQCCVMDRLRQDLRDAIAVHVPDARAAGVLAALSLGDQAAIDRGDWDVFRRTGTAHLVSVSGLHITMFAWLAARLVNALWLRSAHLALRCPAPQAAKAAGLAAAWTYSMFAGWGVPAQRTVCMLAVATLLSLAGGRWPWVALWAASAVAVTLFDPWALLQPGFWLSFAAVGLLLASSSRSLEAQAAPAWPAGGLGPGPRPFMGPGAKWPAVARAARAARAFIHDSVGTQWVATIGLTPLSLVFFQQVSIVGFIANVVAIPLVSFVVMPLSLLGAAWAPLWTLAAAVTAWLGVFLGWLAGLSGASWYPPVAPAWAQAAGLLAGALLILPLPWRLRALGLPLALTLLWPAVPHPAWGQFDLLAADIGQGTAVIVRTAHHAMVFDAGPQYGMQADAGQRVLLPLLRAQGIGRLDKLVLSHRDTDHVGGAASLMRGIDVSELLSSLEPGHPLLRLNANPRRCEAGQRWTWDGVRFDVLSPPANAYAAPGAKLPPPNTLSCVVKVSSASGVALLTGDIERAQEDALVQAAPATLRADVLLVPHHGSHTSSSAGFIAAVSPRTAVIQSGYLNRYGHPAADVMARYVEAGVPLVQTTSCGAWQWHPGAAPASAAAGPAAAPATAPASSLNTACERRARPHYWRR